MSGHSSRLRRIAGLVAGVAVGVTLFAAITPSSVSARLDPALQDSGEDADITLADVARANARYHSITRAERSDYAGDIVPDCMDDEQRGGMGVHWINEGLLTDGEITPLRPEALVYELDERGKKTLVAVEWVMPPNQEYPSKDEGGTGPVLFDQDFTWHPTLEVWKLHAWLFRPNPDGLFADYNPWVETCPSPDPQIARWIRKL